MSVSFSRKQIRKFFNGVTPAEITFIDGVTAGTATASKALVLDGSKGIATITSATITTLTSTTVGATTGNITTVNATNIDAGASGTAGSVDVFPATAANGKMILAAVNAGGAFNTTISNKTMGQSSVVSIPDPGAATADFVLTEGTQTVNGTKTITTLNTTNLDVGASGTAGSVDVFPTTASKGKLTLVAADSAGNTTTTITNASQATTRSYTIPDAGANGKFALAGGNAAVTLSGTGGTSTGTMTTLSAQVTSASITTAGGATHVATITYTGIASTDIVLITKAGGSNSGTENYSYKAVCTTDTITVTLSNHTAATALNGTVIFNILVIKA